MRNLATSLSAATSEELMAIDPSRLSASEGQAVWYELQRRRGMERAAEGWREKWTRDKERGLPW